MIQCVRCFVSGRVQGVFYRARACSEAMRLGISAMARNLEDGRVEVLARGDPEKVKVLREWLWQGPPASRVDDVVCDTIDEQDYASVDWF